MRALPYAQSIAHAAYLGPALGIPPLIGEAQTPTTEPGGAAQPAQPDLSALLKRLGDPDFAVRSEAQRTLDQVDEHQRPTLVQLAATTADPEVRSRLEARIGAIDAQLALNPPPISLDIDKASLSQLSKALGESVGVPFDFFDLYDNPDVRFTVHAKDRPFWEVFEQLSHQHGLELGYLRRPELYTTRPGLASFSATRPGNFRPQLLQIRREYWVSGAWVRGARPAQDKFRRWRRRVY